MKNFFRKGIPLLVVCLAACTHVQNMDRVIIPLRESELYDPFEVSHFITTNKDSNKALSQNYYSRVSGGGGSAQPDQAIYMLKRSISLYPTSDHYRELGTLLCNQKDYKEMNEVYRLLVFPVKESGSTGNYIFEKPDQSTVVEYVVSNILAYNTVWNSKAEQLALTDGLGIKMDDIKDKVLHDTRIKLSKPTEENRNVLWQFLTTDEKLQYFNDDSASENSYNTMSQNTGVFEMDRNQLHKYMYANSPVSERDYNRESDYQTSYDKYVIEMKESESGYRYMDYPMSYNFERKFKVTDSLKALLYAVDSSAIASPKDFRCIYHRLIIYNKAGIMTDNKVIAMQVGEKFWTVKFNTNRFTIIYYKRSWERPFAKDDFDNHVSKIEETGQEEFEISSGGKIKSLGLTSVNNKAST